MGVRVATALPEPKAREPATQVEKLSEETCSVPVHAALAVRDAVSIASLKVTATVLVGATVSLPSGYATVTGFSHTFGYKKFGDIVMLRGVARRTSGAVTTLMTLPAGYRPAAARRLPASASGSNVGAVDINTDGTVVIVSGSPADYFSIDGVVFSL